MPRVSDKSLTIEKRVNSANRKNGADLIVSVHANSAGNKDALGVETLCMNSSLFKSSGTFLDARCKKVVNLLRDEKYTMSSLLAKSLQANVISSARGLNQTVVNRGIKYVVPRLLLGVDIPGALVEIGFLSNKTEAKLLKNKRYQLAIARGIYSGIASYFTRLDFLAARGRHQ